MEEKKTAASGWGCNRLEGVAGESERERERGRRLRVASERASEKEGAGG